MPEGHVIHRLARDLAGAFAGHTPAVSSPQGRFAVQAAAVDGSVLTGAEAFGKHLFVTFDAPLADPILYVHLGLIGTWRFEDPSSMRGQIRLRIATDEVAAHLRGPQACRLISPAEKDTILAVGGADPLRPGTDPAQVLARAGASGRRVASLLMDQKLFPGVGNIYRAETLFRLGINPGARGTDIPLEVWWRVWEDLVLLMAEGVRTGRIDTVRDEHTPVAMGRPPRKDDHGGEVYVYRRQGLPCFVCGTAIAMTQWENRNLFWCPGCQGSLP